MKNYLLIILISTVYLYSENFKIEENIEQAQKSLFITFDRVGFDKDIITAPLMDCRKNCEEIKNWSIPIDRYFLEKVKLDSEKQLLEIEFDVINRVNDIFIFDKDNKVFSQKFKGVPYNNEAVDFETYRDLLNKHINNNKFQEPMRIVLENSLVERVTFKNIKEISKKLRTKLLKKSYLIALYIDELKTEFRVVESRKDSGFNLKTDINLVLKALIYQYDPETKKLNLYSTFDGGSLNIDATNNLKELYSINYFDSEFQAFPRKEDGLESFKTAFKSAFEIAYREILGKMDKLSQFRTYAPILTITKDIIKFNQLNHRELLKINAPVYFQDIDDNGNIRDIAWGKIIETGVLDNNSTKESEAKILKGLKDVENLSFTFLPNWSGIFVGINSGLLFGDINHNDKTVASTSTMIISGDISLDLGFLFNQKYLSNYWFNFSIYSGKESISMSGKDYISNLKPHGNIYGFQIGGEYKHYMKSIKISNFSMIPEIPELPFYLSLGLDFGSKYSEYSINYYNKFSDLEEFGDGKLYIYSNYLDLKGKAGFNISPDLEIISTISYSYPIFQNSFIKDGTYLKNSDMDFVDTDSIGYSGLFGISFGAKFSY